MEDLFLRRTDAQELVKSVMTADDWRRVAQTDQIELMRVSQRWLGEPFATELLQLVAEKEPLLIFQQFEDIRRQVPEANDLLQTAAERASQVDPGVIFFYFPLIQDTSYASQVLTKAAEGCLALKRTSALEFAQHYLTHPEAEFILSRTAERFPTQAIYFYASYQAHPSAGKILRAAVGLDPKGAMVHANKYAEAKEAKALLTEAVAKEPETARMYRDRYVEYLE